MSAQVQTILFFAQKSRFFALQSLTRTTVLVLRACTASVKTNTLTTNANATVDSGDPTAPVSKIGAKVRCSVCSLGHTLLETFQPVPFVLVADLNECILESPCQNGGVCEDTIDLYKCICPEFVTGTNCTGRTSCTIARVLQLVETIVGTRFDLLKLLWRFSDGLWWTSVGNAHQAVLRVSWIPEGNHPGQHGSALHLEHRQGSAGNCHLVPSGKNGSESKMFRFVR